MYYTIEKSNVKASALEITQLFGVSQTDPKMGLRSPPSQCDPQWNWVNANHKPFRPDQPCRVDTQQSGAATNVQYMLSAPDGKFLKQQLAVFKLPCAHAIVTSAKFGRI
jgi:hypothetical protein